MAHRVLRIGVLGGGSWGTTVANLVAARAPTILWARDAAVAREIAERHSNERYLPGARLSKALRATADIGEAVSNADVLVIGVPSQGMRQTAIEVRRHIRPWVPVISLAKGFETDTGLRMTQVIGQELPGHPLGVLTGPNLAGEILAGMAAASVLAMEDEVIVAELQRLFRGGLFRVYTNTDLTGSELGGALKNVFAIAAGMGDGLGAGFNTRSALLTRSIAEMTRLGVALGGRPETFTGLTGLGDLITTCTSPLSRNRTVGFELGKGRSLQDIIAGMNQVAEGVKSSGPIYQAAKALGIEVPIITEVYRVVHEGRSPSSAFRGLLRRGAGSEAEPG
ncbi:NAD(P)H-dependent glycerol-3-phosphate dehydrogenase [Sphingomonas tabacisoli]|uniref:Glycerol-3-phosphate dehydrogenase [NAD(P)+] n=1 Tax=Sphingomonas tabacisoli TaxID=2249466 RepID=A0ABW4I5Q8_9SPHN